jgi:hypothetical protein
VAPHAIAVPALTAWARTLATSIEHHGTTGLPAADTVPTLTDAP